MDIAALLAPNADSQVDILSPCRCRKQGDVKRQISFFRFSAFASIELSVSRHPQHRLPKGNPLPISSHNLFILRIERHKPSNHTSNTQFPHFPRNSKHSNGHRPRKTEKTQPILPEVQHLPTIPPPCPSHHSHP